MLDELMRRPSHSRFAQGKSGGALEPISASRLFGLGATSMSDLRDTSRRRSLPSV
jgi:hypothetical protein